MAAIKDVLAVKGDEVGSKADKQNEGNILENTNIEKEKPSYKVVFLDNSVTMCPPSACFNGVILEQPTMDQRGFLESGTEGCRDGGNTETRDPEGGGGGKSYFPGLKTLSLSPNEDMVKAIRSEQSHLRNIAIFFVCMHNNSLPSRKNFDDWVENVWGKKLGIHVSFYRMIQKGLFVVFFRSHNMQERVLKKVFQSIGHSLFRAFPWSPKGNYEQVVERFSPNWVELKQLQQEFWPFIPQILKPLGSML